jgi:hypothetical protein
MSTQGTDSQGPVWIYSMVLQVWNAVDINDTLRRSKAEPEHGDQTLSSSHDLGFSTTLVKNGYCFFKS